MSVATALMLLCAVAASGCAAGLMRPAAEYQRLARQPVVAPSSQAGLREVVLVGNNWKGTASIIDAQTFRVLKTMNMVPDKEERLSEIEADPGRKFEVALLRRIVGEGNDQLVDDLFTSTDGRVIYASRPSFGDVVAISIQDGRPLWRTRVSGFRSDHAALSPNGKILLVSATRGKRVHALSTEDGTIVGEFASGDEPHESNYSPDGSMIYHASIGRVYVHTRRHWLDWSKGDRRFQLVDADTLSVRPGDIFDIKKLAKASGWELPDSAVRPMALSNEPRPQFAYLQVSFLHGFVELDLEKKKVTRVKSDLFLSLDAQSLRSKDYQINSAHHGITLSGDGKKLCVAGTISKRVAIVNRDSFMEEARVDVGAKPYWATTSADGRYCYVSVSGEDQLVVVSFDDGRVVARVKVDTHPQRVRNGGVAGDLVGPAAE